MSLKNQGVAATPKARNPPLSGGFQVFDRNRGLASGTGRRRQEPLPLVTEVTSESLTLVLPTLRLGSLPVRSTPVTTPVIVE